MGDLWESWSEPKKAKNSTGSKWNNKSFPVLAAVGRVGRTGQSRTKLFVLSV